MAIKPVTIFDKQVLTQVYDRDVTIEMPALPDGTPARTFMGSFFAWAFDAPGEYLAKVTSGDDLLITVKKRDVQIVTASPATLLKVIDKASQHTEIRLPFGTYDNLPKIVLKKAGLRIVAQDRNSRPRLVFKPGGGFEAAARDIVLQDLKARDSANSKNKQDTNLCTVRKGASVYVEHVDVENMDGVIHTSEQGQVGIFARNVNATVGMRAYPFGMFGGQNFAFVDVSVTDYDGLEHPLRLNATGTKANTTQYPAGNGLIAYSTFKRKNDAKEPFTIRHAVNVSVHDNLLANGYAVRLSWERAEGQPTTPSENIRIRRNTFDNVPLWIQDSGCKTLVIENNEFRNLAKSKGLPISFETGRQLIGVRVANNRWPGGSGEMMKGSAGVSPVIEGNTK